jgi:hypothetical protein
MCVSVKKNRLLETRAATAPGHFAIPYASSIAYPSSRSITVPPRALCYHISGARIYGGWRGQVHYLALGEIPGMPKW